MFTFHSRHALQEHLNAQRALGKKVGLVPTMGALHEGHIALLRLCQKHCDVSVVSIFVNPLQFNNREDLEKYPVQNEKDLALLKQSNCDVVYLPEEKDILSNEIPSVHIDLGVLDKVLEGTFRPGHFDGVVQIVHRLFKITEPHLAVFGEKDLQQAAVVKKLQRTYYPNVKILVAPTQREPNGLAMSSRNLRLSENGKKKAGVIFDSFQKAKAARSEIKPLEIVRDVVLNIKAQNLDVEYVAIVEADSFEDLTKENNWMPNAYICCAVICEGVRLIDNISLEKN